MLRVRAMEAVYSAHQGPAHGARAGGHKKCKKNIKMKVITPGGRGGGRGGGGGRGRGRERGREGGRGVRGGRGRIPTAQYPEVRVLVKTFILSAHNFNLFLGIVLRVSYHFSFL